MYVSRSGDVIATEISTCKMEDMGIEMTCDSIDDQDNGIEMCDKDDMVDQSCLCGGFSFFNRRFWILYDSKTKFDEVEVTQH